MRRVTAVAVIVGALLAAAPDASPAAEPAPAFDLGGAVRVNYGWLDYAPDSGNLDLELLRLDLDCNQGRFVCSAQYRWYDGFSAIHHVMLACVDWIAGRNMWFVGGPGVGIADPGGERWRSRLNINVGFYF